MLNPFGHPTQQHRNYDRYMQRLHRPDLQFSNYGFVIMPVARTLVMLMRDARLMGVAILGMGAVAMVDLCPRHFTRAFAQVRVEPADGLHDKQCHEAKQG